MTTITDNNGLYILDNGITTDNNLYAYGNGTLTGGNLSTLTSYIDYNTHFDSWETVDFLEIDDKLSSVLDKAYKKIVNNCIYFNVYIDGRTVRPIDDILLMIEKKQTFEIKISRCGYEILISNARFTKIKNLIETSAKEYIMVEFEYGNMKYDNTLKSELEKRLEKMDLLKYKIENK